MYSSAPPTALELSLSVHLEKTLRANNMYESEGEASHREDVRQGPSLAKLKPTHRKR